MVDEIPPLDLFVADTLVPVSLITADVFLPVPTAGGADDDSPSETLSSLAAAAPDPPTIGASLRTDSSLLDDRILSRSSPLEDR